MFDIINAITAFFTQYQENAEIRVDNVEEYQLVVDAEWNILYEKLQKLHDAGKLLRMLPP